MFTANGWMIVDNNIITHFVIPLGSRCLLTKCQLFVLTNKVQLLTNQIAQMEVDKLTHAINVGIIASMRSRGYQCGLDIHSIGCTWV